MRKAEATATTELPIHSVWAKHHMPCPIACGCLQDHIRTDAQVQETGGMWGHGSELLRWSEKPIGPI
jgi:hypothetical protein